MTVCLREENSVKNLCVHGSFSCVRAALRPLELRNDQTSKMKCLILFLAEVLTQRPNCEVPNVALTCLTECHIERSDCLIECDSNNVRCKERLHKNRKIFRSRDFKGVPHKILDAVHLFHDHF